MPSRTYNIMAAGKPILALTDEGSELARVIDEEGIGWHLEPGDAVALEAAILTVYEERTQLAEKGRRARAASEQKYSLTDACEAYRDALN